MAEAAPSAQRKQDGGRRRGVVRAVALVLAALLAGCQTVVPRGPREAPPPRPSAAPTQAAPIDNGIPRDTARNRVALLVPTGGRDGAVGRSLANATQLALLDSGNEKVRITTYDTAGGAGAAARRAIAEGAELILGPLLADDVRAVAPIAHAAGVPVIGFSNDISVAGGGVYLMAPLPAESVERVVQYARSRGITSFAGLVPVGTYGERSSTAFLRAVEAAGGQVTALETYAPGGGAAAVQKLAVKAPYGAVLIADGSRVAALLAPGVHRSSPAAHILGTDRWNAEPGLRSQAALAGAWFASVPNGLYQQFVAKYRGRFGEDPYRLSSLGYDAVLLTIRIARDWPVGQRFPEVRLRDPGGFAGLDGAFRFGRDGLADRGMEVQEVRGGQIVTVSPAPTGFGK